MTDTGLADPSLAAALAGWRAARTPAARAAALAALAGARVFVAVTARSTAEHVDPGTGLRAESTAEMALITLAGSTGRGLPVFLDVPSVTGFLDGARPVPLSLSQVCQAARDDDAAAVVVDPAATHLVLTADELDDLAAGRLPVPGAPVSTRATTAALTAPSTVDPQLLDAVAAALRPEALRGARLLDGPDGLVLGVVPQRELSAAELAAIAARIAPRLPCALDLAVVPPHGPGLTVAVRRGWFRRGR